MRWLFVGVVSLVAACASAPPDRLELMPAPEVFQDGKVDPFEGLCSEGQWAETDILYATDRDSATAEDAERYYANRRGYLVRLGRASIVHADGRLTWQEARQTSLTRERKIPYSLRVGAVEEIGILADSASPFSHPAKLPANREGPATEFAAAVNRKLARSNKRDIVVYVHGYKVPFEDPLLVSTELWHFLGYDGVLNRSPPIAGYSLTYRRPFKIGDRIRINDTVGEVAEIRVLTTRLRSPKNEEIVVPNTDVLNGAVVNYSTLARKQGLILHTTVGIGYETPWRQVDAMLKLAAARTPGLLEEPEPFVLKTGLTDFAVTYELNVYCAEPMSLPKLYNALHENILDLFNEYDVAIMTPAYEADTPEPKLVPRDQWYAAPAIPPSESVSG